MKTAISIPDNLFAAADRLAQRLGVSRSQLYQTALTAYLTQRDDDDVTARLDEVHGCGEPVTVDPVLDALQHVSLPREPW